MEFNSDIETVRPHERWYCQSASGGNSYGLTFLASYTWSKSLDYGGSAASGGGAAGGPQTITNLRAGYGPSGFDVPHRFVGSWTWETPFGRGRRYLNSGLVSNLVGGWEIDGISSIQSGLPFSVYLSSCVNNASSCWPDRIASGRLSNPDYSRWHDPTAFAAPCAVGLVNGTCSQYAYRFGNSGRGILRAPGTFNFDLSAVKNFAVKERIKAQPRLDAFNALNHPQFGFPNQNINPANPAATSTAITSTIKDNRDLQAANRDPVLAAGRAKLTEDREMEAAAKVSLRPIFEHTASLLGLELTDSGLLAIGHEAVPGRWNRLPLGF